MDNSDINNKFNKNNPLYNRNEESKRMSLLYWDAVKLSGQDIRSAIAKAVTMGFLEGVIHFFENYTININTQCTGNGYTLLHIACNNKHINIVKYLVEHGANINLQTFDGETALHLACDDEHTICKTYSSNGTLESATPMKMTNFHPMSHKTEIAEYLIEHGADTTILDKYGKTAQFYLK